MSVKGGTPNFSNPSICDSCTHLYKRTGDREVIRVCKAIYELPAPIKGKVFECTDFVASNKPTLYEMQKMALILVKKGDQVGFIKSSEFRDKHGIKDHDELVPDFNVKQY